MVILFGEVKERASDNGVVGDELTVEVGEAKEGMHFLDFDGGWPYSNAIKFNWVHSKLTGFHDHSKKFNFKDVELAFLKLEVEVELHCALEDMTGSFSVGFRVKKGNEEVIHVDDKPSLHNHVPEGVIHESLEYGGGITETKEHNSGFEESFVGDEGGFSLVTVFDTDIVVPPMNIELGEMSSVFQLVHEVGDEGEGVCITGGVFI